MRKYKVSDEKAESLTDVTMEWNSCKMDEIDNDPDVWFSRLYRINLKFKKINVNYENNEECMKTCDPA